MKIIPSEKIELLTSLSIQEVRKVLSDSIRPKQRIFFGFKKPKDNKLFEGIFDQDRFAMQRIVKGKNSFLQIKGRIHSNLNGTKLVVDLKTYTSVVIFMTIWLGGVSLGLVITIVGIVEQGTNPFLAIIPLIMLAFGIRLVHSEFNNEKEKSISDLKKIFNAQVKEEAFANTGNHYTKD